MTNGWLLRLSIAVVVVGLMLWAYTESVLPLFAMFGVLYYVVSHVNRLQGVIDAAKVKRKNGSH